MPIIIDGWNFIRDRSSRIRGDGDDALDSARTLIAYMCDFQQTHRDPVILVFDSKHEYLDIDFANTEKLKVIPAKNADAYIKRYVEAIPEKQRRNLRVVSSDNSVYYHARDAYATAIKSSEFWAKLYPSKQERDEDE